MAHTFEFRLVGCLIGLALYNGATLDLRFPPAVYRDMLRSPEEATAAGMVTTALGGLTPLAPAGAKPARTAQFTPQQPANAASAHAQGSPAEAAMAPLQRLGNSTTGSIAMHTQPTSNPSTDTYDSVASGGSEPGWIAAAARQHSSAAAGTSTAGASAGVCAAIDDDDTAAAAWDTLSVALAMTFPQVCRQVPPLLRLQELKLFACQQQ